MRRIIITITAVAVLAAAAAAYAASLNNYGAKLSFSPSKAGSPSSPLPIAYTTTLTASNATAGSRAAPLVDIKTTIYGLVANSKPFPTCDGPQMSVRKSDSFCPAKALVATGPVTSLLGNNILTTRGSPCNPFLHVWNAGGGKLWFFFTTDAAHVCAGGALHTGDTAAYPGFITQKGKNFVLDVPLPPDVSTKVANQPNFYGSLIKEVLTFRKLTTNSHGKNVGFTSSVACKNGKRPWTVKYTAVSGSARESKTVSGKAPC